MNQFIFPLLIAVLAVPLILSFRKQKKMQQAAQDLQKSIGVGDRVMTTSGLYATVVNADDETTIDLEIAPGVVTTWLRPAVREKVSEDATENTDDTTGSATSVEASSTDVNTTQTSGATVAPPLEQR